MKKTFLILLTIICNTLNGYCQNWRGGVSYSTQSGGCSTEPLVWVGPSSFVSNGIAKVPGGVGACPFTPSTYFTQIEMLDTLCITNNFSFEVRVRNNSIFRNDISVSLIGSGQTTGCYLIGYNAGDPVDQMGAAQFSSAFVGGTTISNNIGLTFPIDTNFHIIKLQYRNNILEFFNDGVKFFSLPYTGSICNINNMRVAFKGSGELDWMRILDATGNLLWTENFNSANTLVKVPNLCNPSFGANLSFTSPTCSRDTLLLFANPVTSGAHLSYSWTGPNGFTTTDQNPKIASPNILNSGWYFCTTSLNSCNTLSAKDSTLVNFTTASIPAIMGSNAVCVNNKTMLSNSVAGGLWSSSNTSIATVSQLGEVTGISAGFATITYSIPNSACLSSLKIEVGIIGSSIVGKDSICINSNVLLSNSTIGGIWQTDNPSIATINNSGLLTGVMPGSVLVTYSIGTGINACKSTLRVVILEKSPLKFAVNSVPSTVCENQTVLLNNATAINNISWRLNPLDLTQATLSCNICPTTNFISNVSKVYNIIVGGNDNYGCLLIDTFKLPIAPKARIDFLPLKSVCQNDMPFNLTATIQNGVSGTGFFSGNGIVNPNTGLFNPSQAKMPIDSIKYNFITTDGCLSQKTNYIVINPRPDITFLQKYIEVKFGNNVFLNPSISGGSNNTFVWFPTTYLIDPLVLNANSLPLKSITYKLNVVSDSGCVNVDSISIKIKSEIVIPNVFSPNADGINDFWEIKDKAGVLLLKATVFDRYGKLIHTSFGNRIAWNGNYNGKPMPVATYYYVIVATDGSRDLNYSGWVQLLR